ncbi:DUF424 family protein [Candidatus Marsarchaeota archaeon]|nr:DUF424 family protein [Candidatus Marsarchaeota archaeon]MCL5404507.1 DUF424 family protein [Candidatus Marsarchaeota archaeon]
MIYFKIHDTDEGKILAMCDQELIGNVYEDGDILLDLKDYADFYTGDLVRDNEVGIEPGEKFNSANVVGKASVKVAIEKDIIKSENVKSVNGIPYAHAYWLDID